MLTKTEHHFMPGASFVCDSKSPKHIYMVSFEDDGQQAHFFAIDPRREKQPICDARLIYAVNDLADDLKSKQTKMTILWDHEGKRALLTLDDHAHAMVDFVIEKAYCRTGKPYITTWLQDDFRWQDRLLKFFEHKRI